MINTRIREIKETCDIEEANKLINSEENWYVFRTYTRRVDREDKESPIKIFIVMALYGPAN